MLRDVIDFIVSRTDLSRTVALREINYAWTEMWNTSDFPGSLFEVTVEPIDNTSRISLAHYVGQIKAVKTNSQLRVALNTPRPHYHDGEFRQSPWTWRILGNSPLNQSIVNATTLNLEISEAEESQFTVALTGPTDNAAESIDRIVFEPGETEKQTVLRFTDLKSATKSILTKSNVLILGANGEEFGYIANSEYEARNTVIQITDKCDCVCTSCRCFDILYKIPAPILVHEEMTVMYEHALMNKTLEWIMLPKENGEQKAILFGDKSNAMLSGYNRQRPEEHKMDLGVNQFVTRHWGSL